LHNTLLTSRIDIQALAVGSFVSGCLENRRNGVAKRRDPAAGYVLPHGDSGPLHPRVPCAAVHLLPLYAQEPICVRVEYGPGDGHCVRHVLELGHTSGCDRLPRGTQWYRFQGHALRYAHRGNHKHGWYCSIRSRRCYFHCSGPPLCPQFRTISCHKV
jgi:hypothetical protein